MLSSKTEIFNMFNEYKMYFLFFFILSPIFISLDFSHGLKFDACVVNLYSKPSIPISFFLLGLIAIGNIKQLIVNKHLVILLMLIVTYIIFNLYYGTSRGLIVGLGMMLPLVSFYTFKIFFNKNKELYRRMYITLFYIIILKFIFDLYRININHTNIDVIISYMFNGRFNTSYYFLNSFRIYNYYDYFSFIYYSATVLSLYNIINNTMPKKSLLLIIVSNIVILSTGSRLFIYGIYLIPILYVFYKITKFRLEVYFYIFITLSLSITLLIGFVDFNIHELSLSTRNNLAYNYFKDFSLINVVLPFINQYRLETVGSFHNELLEIFSFFGFVMIYYYYLIMKIYSGVNKKYKLISFLLMFIIIIGALVQINISNPYIGIILGMILAILSLDDKNEKLKNDTA